MTRAEWKRKHLTYHPVTCRACSAPIERQGACGRCNDARARSNRYPSMRRKRQAA